MMVLSEKDKEFLKTYDASAYEKFSLSVDTSLFRYTYEKGKPAKLELLLIKRKNSPYENAWALPGGFCELGEDLKTAAKRELFEETGLKARYYGQVHTYSEVSRDPRTRVVGTNYLAVLPFGKESKPEANDDAKEAAWFEVTMHRMPIDQDNYHIKLGLKNEHANLSASIAINRKEGEWERTLEHSEGLAFDHAKMIAMATEALRQKAWQSDLAFNFLEKEFALFDLQRIFETITRKELLRTTFFTHIKPLIKLVDAGDEGILEQRYRFNDAFRFKDASSMLELWQ